MAKRHFIPFRYADLARLCADVVGADVLKQQQFGVAKERIEQHFSQEFSQWRNRLKQMYAPLDPDADTLTLSFDNDDSQGDVLEQMQALLQRANYVRVSPEALKRAFAASSLFQVRLKVNMNDFDEVVLFTRGASEQQETLPWLFGLRQRTVHFINYERVVLCLRFKDEAATDSALGGCRPGTTLLKLFQNVPDADLEMLFPNTQVGMRWRDKLMIGVPALISGVVMLSTKLGATLILLGSLIGFWLGWHSNEVSLDRTTLLALGAGFGALGAYLWKQYASFKNRRLRFTQALTQNLYFKLLDNNQGVILRVLDEAQDSECKEALLAYSFLARCEEPVEAAALDAAVEAWFQQQQGLTLDFDIVDALAKLEALGLAQVEAGQWRVNR